MRRQAVLINEGRTDLVAPQRILFLDAPNCVRMLGKPTETAIYSPFSFRQIAEFIFFLPLNLIPLFGTPAFLVITGARAGPLHHYRYFKLRGLTKKEKREEIRSRRWKYTWYVEPSAAERSADEFGQVWNYCVAVAASACVVDVLPAYDGCGICSLGYKVGGAEEDCCGRSSRPSGGRGCGGSAALYRQSAVTLDFMLKAH
jgi:hypothetical protein